MADNGLPTGALGGSLIDLVSNLKNAVTNLANINQTLRQLFPRINGTFTLSAATTTDVAESRVVSNSLVFVTPSNATAALIVRSNGLYHSTNTAGTSFTLSTQSGSAASGGIFEYIVINPN
jgi:hypothetical protein